MKFMESIKNRRSYYGITNQSPVADDKIIEIVEQATLYVPSAFNDQSQMVMLLLGENHTRLWDITMETLRKIVPSDKFAGTEKKINSFKNGYGTVMYFNDDSITKTMQNKFPLYADNFPVWAEQSNGMLQFAIWNLLECNGLGASLQHYNPLIDSEIAKAFQVPKEWRLIAQMPFGGITLEPDVKQFNDISERVKIVSNKGETMKNKNINEKDGQNVLKSKCYGVDTDEPENQEFIACSAEFNIGCMGMELTDKQLTENNNKSNCKLKTNTDE